MKLNLRYLLFILLVILSCSCKSPAERWLDRLPDYKQVHSKELSLQLLKMKIAGDTSAFYYRVRITPSANNKTLSGDQVNFYYAMDSCFYLKAGEQVFKPSIVQAVPNGIKGCFEYLLSFNISKPMLFTPVNLVYQDKFIDGKVYSISLNKQ
jgi:hypothetical protein